MWATLLEELVTTSSTRRRLFLFAEPTPWQLFRVIEVVSKAVAPQPFEKDRDWCFLDSSAESGRQHMNARDGPGVLGIFLRES